MVKLIQHINLGLILLFLLPATTSWAYKITVELDNYESDTLLFGYYYGDKQYIKDTSVCDKRDKFVFKGKEDLDPGMYLIIMRPRNEFVQIIVPENDQKIHFSLDYNNAFNSLRTKNSSENQIFLEYLSFLQVSRIKADSLQKQLDRTEDENERSNLQAGLDLINKEVRDNQQRIVQQHPETFTALIINTNEQVEVPDFDGSVKEQEEQQYQYYVKHFFDRVDLKDDRLSYSSFLLPKVTRYIDQLIPQIPDSINKALDLILGRAEGSEHNFKFLLVHHLNKYANSKYVGMDGVYVHLVDNYYTKGKAPWVSDENLLKMMKNSMTLKPLLIGKVAPDIRVYKQDKSPVSLHEIKSKYLALYFWAPDCGHCKKSLPKLKTLYPELQERGVEVMAVCSKLMDKEATCWEYIDENQIDLWINASDQFLKSRFKQIYDVVKTPQLYLLDADKKIITKKIGIEQIIGVLDTIESNQ